MKNINQCLTFIAIFLLSSCCREAEHQVQPLVVRVAPSEGGEIRWDGLALGYGMRDVNYVLECYRIGGGVNDDLLLPSGNYHGMQPSMIPPKTTRFERRMLPVRGTPYVVCVNVSNIVANAKGFVSGIIEISVVKQSRQP
jgi:hypothetical protein